MIKIHRHLQNESGIATLLMVVAGLVIVALVGMNFIIEQENKHQGSAVTVNAEQAQANAEAGYRYAVKCLQGDDPACTCNGGGNDCADWLNVPDIPSLNFGNAGSFEVEFTNRASCSIEISSTGIVNNTRRTINNVLTRNAIGGAVTAITMTNPQAVLGPPIPPIAVLNQQRIGETAPNNSTTITFPNYSIPAGSNLVLVVMAGAESQGGNGNRAVPSGVTFGGTPMLLANRGFSPGNQSDPGVGLFYLSVPTGITGDVVATFQGNTQNRALGIATLSNALAPPEAIEFTTMGNANVPQVDDNITTLSTNAMIVSAAYYKLNNDLFEVGAGHTEIPTFFNVPNAEAEGAMGFRPGGTVGLKTGTGFRRWPFGGFGFTQDNMVMVLAAFPHANRTISMNYTVPAVGSNQILVVVAGAEDGIAPTFNNSTIPISATFNGNAMNLIDTETETSTSFEAGVGMFWLGVNAGDTGTITVTYTDSAIDNKTLHAYTLNNAVGPEIDKNKRKATLDSSLTQTLTALLPAGSMVASGGYQGNRNDFTAIPSPAHSLDTQIQAPSSQGVMGSYPVPTAQVPPAIGFETNPDFNRMVLLLAAFGPAGGGGICLP